MEPTGTEDLAMKRFARLAWAVVAFYVFVIVWGALVRMTGSGAGCDDGWPLCGGSAVPLFEDHKTVIEYVHRVTSGLTLVFGFWLYLRSRALFSSKHPVRYFAAGAFICLLIEALFGAIIVKFHLVEENDSLFRTLLIGVHLANTLVLLGFGSACAIVAGQEQAQGIQKLGRLKQEAKLLLAALVLTSMAGAVTALADTLNKIGAIESDHFLNQVKWAHPVIAMTSAAIVFYLAHQVWTSARPGSASSKWSLIVLVLLGLQVVLGLINIQQVIPYWAQLTHLFVADLLWIATLLMLLDPLEDSRFLKS